MDTKGTKGTKGHVTNISGKACILRGLRALGALRVQCSTGKPIMMLSKDPLKMYPVKVEGDDIILEI